MKIYGLDSEIVVDSIPLVYESNRKIFLTSLTHIDTHTLPKIFPKIYTSETLKKQFILYLKNKNIEIPEDNFHVWKPFESEKISLSNGTCYEIMPCFPKDSSTSISLVFRQGSTISHIYVGLCSDLRSTLLNVKLVSWLRKGANTALYVPINKVCKRCVDCELRKAMKKIEKKLNSDNLAKLLIQLPIFGSEAFITAVASEFRGLVAICGLLKEMYMILPTFKSEYFTEDFRSARIVISGHDTTEFLSENLKRDGCTISKKYTIKWSPLPSLNELNLLSDLVQPSKLYGTKFEESQDALEQPVQISSVFYGPLITSKELTALPIKRQTLDDDHCCLEKSQRLEQQVIENVKMFLNHTTKRSQSKQNYNQTIVDLTILTPTEQRTNNATNVSERTIQDREIHQETSHQQSENQPLNSVENQEETVRNSIERDKQTVENSPKTVKSPQQTEISQLPEKSGENQIKNVRRMSTRSATGNDKIENKQIPKTKENQKVGKQKKSCANKSSLVYRKGKKGIGFVDDDSSSSG